MGIKNSLGAGKFTADGLDAEGVDWKDWSEGAVFDCNPELVAFLISVMQAEGQELEAGNAREDSEFFPVGLGADRKTSVLLFDMIIKSITAMFTKIKVNPKTIRTLLKL